MTPSAAELQSQLWDVIVVGTGVGGSTLGYALARSGVRVLFLEKGLDLRPSAAVIRGRFVEECDGFRALSKASRDEILSAGGRSALSISNGRSSFIPYVGCGTGGSSALYGMAMERFFPSDFAPSANYPSVDGSSLPDSWPVSYEDLRPWYCHAEQLFRVRGTPDPLRDETDQALLRPEPLVPANRRIFEQLASAGLHPYRLHLACERVSDCHNCQGYLCDRSCKNDAAKVCLTPAIEQHGARLLAECEVLRLDADRLAVRQVFARHRGDLLAFQSKVVVLAGGALATPALLLSSASADWPFGLANSSRLVGRNLMRHCIDLYVLGETRNSEEVRQVKEIAFSDLYFRDGVKLGTVQSFGLPPPLPYLLHQPGLNPWRILGKYLTEKLVQRYGRAQILATVMEDLPYASNGVEMVGRQLHLSYRLGPSERERRRHFRKRVKELLRPLRPLRVAGSDDRKALGHVCGTCRAGYDPKSSVVDRWNRAHALDNLYIVDASFFPSSAGVNPALTIGANALRVASQIVERL